jgi:hypothetical protein
MAKGTLHLPQDEIKRGDAVIHISVLTEKGKSTYKYSMRGYEGNLSNHVKSDLGAFFLELLKTKLGGMVHELPPSR